MPNDSIEISPSILAANFLELGAAVRDAEEAGAERMQIDVMDGRFVPNITMGPDIVRAIRSATRMLLEVHLMIVEPEKYVPVFAEAGADVIIVHVEVSPHLYRTLQQIRDHGKQAGVALNPSTPAVAVQEVMHLTDLILVMTVNPGFGGQRFIEEMLPKVRTVRREIDRRGLEIALEVDGGIDDETAPGAVEAGARVLVAGTSVYGAHGGVREAVDRLRASASRGLDSAAGVRP